MVRQAAVIMPTVPPSAQKWPITRQIAIPRKATIKRNCQAGHNLRKFGILIFLQIFKNA